MTAEEIRKWASKAYKDVCHSDEVQMGQMLMLAEIAAQLAELNETMRNKAPSVD